ncbi:hypothetical protein Q8F91_27355, partial [Klebsiella pneumoniae]|nr:hypothetical protein [Klebsiella pneumoniae]
LVAVGRPGPGGGGELGGHLGGGYTPGSRQVEKLEGQGIACKQPKRPERRISEGVPSARGQTKIWLFYTSPSPRD